MGHHQRAACDGGATTCSGHGTCESIRELADADGATAIGETLTQTIHSADTKDKDAKAGGAENGKHRRGKFGQHPDDCPHICCTKNKKQL